MVHGPSSVHGPGRGCHDVEAEWGPLFVGGPLSMAHPMVHGRFVVHGPSSVHGGSMGELIESIRIGNKSL